MHLGTVEILAAGTTKPVIWLKIIRNSKVPNSRLFC